ncbi:capping complex subunit for YIEGIA [Cytobacillus horneckiae]|uniref:capping complex subunit for YIEGIA n=1 Tax=Cytobacillus horneckiae TaxID=549687 RepID=UPI003D9A6E34
MDIEKFILAIITTNPARVPSGTSVFHCENKEEMEVIATNLEAILDGIAHLLTEEIYVIVKH